jgi:hypothetical protein
MGLGPNMVLDKGMLATGGSQAYTFGEAVVATGAGISMARATSAGALCIGICQESADAAKVNTGKAVLNVRIIGISRVLAGAAVAVGVRVTNDTTARAVTKAKAGAGVQPGETFGIALTAATAAGQYIDVLLTPGATF